MQLQINRYVLPTNYSVSWYRQDQTPWCSFCPENTHWERLENLLWKCPRVQVFWTEANNILRIFLPGCNIGAKEAIFGDQISNYFSVFNTFLTWSRWFIWSNKFSSKRLDFISYSDFLSNEIINLNLTMKKRSINSKIKTVWEPVFKILEL